MPAQAVSISENQDRLDENRFTLPGWIAVVQAIIFPVAIALGFIEGVIGKEAFDYRGPILGPSDFLTVIFSAMSVYTLTMFRKLLKEHYDFHKIDTLLIISIWWVILFQVFSLALGILYVVLDPVSDLVTGIVLGTFAGIAMITIGVIDILIGIWMLREKEQFSDLIKGFAYVTLIAGICEVSLLLVPIAMLLVPVSLVLMGLVFLRDKKEIQFV